METSPPAPRLWGAKTAEERRRQRRARLVSAAIALYGKKGFRGTSVKAICDAAGLTQRYFYESFTGSEELLQQCFLEVTRGLTARMREAANDAAMPPVERVRTAILIYLRALQRAPAAARVLLIEIASVSPPTDALVSASLDEFGGLLMDTLDPERTGPASPLLLRGVIGGGLHIAQAWIASGYAEPVDRVAAAALQLYCLVAEDGPGPGPGKPEPGRSPPQ